MKTNANEKEFTVKSLSLAFYTHEAAGKWKDIQAAGKTMREELLELLSWGGDQFRRNEEPGFLVCVNEGGNVVSYMRYDDFQKTVESLTV